MCGVFVEFLPIRVLVTELMANLYMCVCVFLVFYYFFKLLLLSNNVCFKHNLMPWVS